MISTRRVISQRYYNVIDDSKAERQGSHKRVRFHGIYPSVSKSQIAIIQLFRINI
jgi:hypothetical protein